MHPHLREELEFTYTSDTEWDRAEARELGAADPTAAWVCTDRDVWHANPFYKGPPVRHPEDDWFSEEDLGLSHDELEEMRVRAEEYSEDIDDDLPF